MKLVFATNNRNKLDEVSAILGGDFNLISLKELGCREDIPETEKTIEGNAILKARYIHEKYKADCFADDTGLEIEVLNGEPGVYSARYAGGDGHDSEANMNKVLAKLKEESNRKAQFRTCVALILNNKEYLFEGIIKGEITTEKSGESGFGYDPIFRPEGYTETFAELGKEIKNKISHRALAVKELTDFLKKNNL